MYELLNYIVRNTLEPVKTEPPWDQIVCSD